MTSDSNIFKLFRDSNNYFSAAFEVNNSLEFEELTTDNADDKYVLHIF